MRTIAHPIVAIVAVFVAHQAARAGEHPRLLLQPADVNRIRAAVGLSHGSAAADAGAARSADWRYLQSYFHERGADQAMNGEIAAAAFCYLIDPKAEDAARWLALVEESLKDVLSSTHDRIEQIIALDWCWNGLSEPVRRDFLTEARVRTRALALTDSPLDAKNFRERLATLALVLAVGDDEDPAPSWPEQRRSLATAAVAYFEKSLPAFLERRGLAPTSPSSGPAEEFNLILAVELADAVDRKLGWERYGATVGRVLEHYPLTAGSARAGRGFLRDDATRAALLPVTSWESLEPLSAFLLADRTRDPAASFVARNVDGVLHAAQTPCGFGRWASLAFEAGNVRELDEMRLPVVRNLGSAVVLRGREIGADPALIWIETGPAYLRRGQHFDAGHFLIRAGSDLVVAAGEAVANEAITPKGGSQALGRERTPFDFEQFACATISHNALIFCDTSRLNAWYGKPFLPIGGQRAQEGECHDFGATLDADPHRTCNLTAIGMHERDAYVLLDLSPAYDPRTVSNCTREFLMIDGRMLLIVDRAKSTRLAPTWVLQLPTRPTVNGQELNAGVRSAGTDNNGGVWRYDTPGTARWANGTAALSLTALLPAGGRLAAVGGPATQRTVPRGTIAGRAYVGGDADSFERLIIPSSKPQARNAWYRLGEPTLLGADFGTTPLWGRIEIEPAKASDRNLFVTLLSIESAASATPATATCAADGEQFKISIACGADQYVVTIPATSTGGALARTGKPEGAWALPTTLMQDEALPVQPGKP